ncbi:expressed unknown protein [Seminavis robusta]|uniref:Uncharacterized protein n=1 Tax=Seminavis robusta TaxID=568900 RepID=A0A9N8H7J1_9STRA|nr:expressed unknown protein [Seminavis robusta]|eukprot:Sro130_g062130.1 n/a (81) ;mRNA; r:107996-108238
MKNKRDDVYVRYINPKKPEGRTRKINKHSREQLNELLLYHDSESSDSEEEQAQDTAEAKEQEEELETEDEEEMHKDALED